MSLSTKQYLILRDTFDRLDLSVSLTMSLYSGRCMYGEKCPSVRFEKDGDLLKIGAALGRMTAQADRVSDTLKVLLDSPMKTDSLGHDGIAYWPGLAVKWKDLGEIEQQEIEAEG